MYTESESDVSSRLVASFGRWHQRARANCVFFNPISVESRRGKEKTIFNIQIFISRSRPSTSIDTVGAKSMYVHMFLTYQGKYSKINLNTEPIKIRVSSNSRNVNHASSHIVHIIVSFFVTLI